MALLEVVEILEFEVRPWELRAKVEPLEVAGYLEEDDVSRRGDSLVVVPSYEILCVVLRGLRAIFYQEVYFVTGVETSESAHTLARQEMSVLEGV